MSPMPARSGSDSGLAAQIFRDVYANSQGYTETSTRRASKVLNKAFGVPEGRAFGLILGAPA